MFNHEAHEAHEAHETHETHEGHEGHENTKRIRMGPDVGRAFQARQRWEQRILRALAVNGAGPVDVRIEVKTVRLVTCIDVGIATAARLAATVRSQRRRCAAMHETRLRRKAMLTSCASSG